MGGARCVVGGCSNKRSERVSLHQFPKDTNIRQQWVKAIKCTGTNVSRADWNGPSSSKSAQAQLVCSEHFELTCFTLTTRMHWQQGLPYKAALTDEAVPSMFGLQIQEYKKRVENPSSRGAFRKRELERIIGEYEVTTTGNAEQPLPVRPALLQPSAGQVKEALTIHSDAQLPEVNENGLCVSENNQECEDSLSVQTERANLPIKTSEENKSQCPPQCAQGEASDLIKEDGRCLCIKPETTSTGTQVKPGTTVKGVQVSRKVQVTNAVKATQTLRRHTVRMVSSSSQYNVSDCSECLPDRDDTLHCLTPSTSNKKVTIFSPLNMSFQSASTVYMDDQENDPDYMPDDSFHSDTDEECHEQDDPVKQRKFLVFEDNLMELFNSCQVCGHKTEAQVSQVQGSYVAVRQICDCGHTRRWDSQPKVNGVPAGNILLSAGILFSGCSPTKFFRVFNFINVMCVTVNTFFDHQKRILWPAIETTWNNYCVKMMRTLRERGGEVVVAGDGRADSPGHCAKYGVYSFIDMNSGQVIGLHLVQSNEVKSSYHMELEGLKRAVSALNGAGINILEIITDRHMQIQKWIRENMPSTVHGFDVWHIAKSVKKKLVALAKEKDCQDVSRWIKSITNHLYWTAASCNKGDSDLMESKWKSVSSHVQNIHHGHQGPYKECQHDLLQDRVWLKPGSKAAVKVEDIVWGNHLCKAIRKMSTGFQTSTLESFHSVINHFAPKMTSYSYYGQLCRQHLAALHFNENIKREPRKSDNGNLKLKIVFPKFKTGDDYSVKIVSTENTFLYVRTLLDTTLAMCGKKNPMETPIPPPLTSGKRKPSKSEAVSKLSSRYKKLKF